MKIIKDVTIDVTEIVNKAIVDIYENATLKEKVFIKNKTFFDLTYKIFDKFLKMQNERKEEQKIMKLDMDKIIFESRNEIDEIQNALSEWQEEHKKNDNVQRLINLLDAMYMSW